MILTLTFDLYDTKALYKPYQEYNFCTIASRIIKLGMWMHYGKAVCGVTNVVAITFNLTLDLLT